jgi:photosystem II stability/assembly factor-like uncharacterized protein
VVSPRALWAVTDRQLFVTLDGGGTWAERNPPGNGAIAGMFTLDGSRGWIAVVTHGGRRVVVASTEDAGRNWATSSLPRRFRKGTDTAVSLSFIDDRRGWATRDDGFGVFRTEDGGVRWKPRCIRCGVSGPVTFTGPNAGWAVSDRSHLARTRDGGRTWHDILLPKGLPAGGRRVLSLPHFLSPRVGVIEGTFSRTTGTTVIVTTVEFFVVRDGRRSRTESSPLSAHEFKGYLTSGVPADVISEEDWVVGSPAGLYETHDAGRTWGLQVPDVSFDTLAQVDFASAEVGWVLVTDGDCPSGAPNCREGPRLFRTVDGGAHWLRNDPEVER